MGKKQIHEAFLAFAKALAHLEVKKILLTEKQLAVFYKKMDRFDKAYKSLLEKRPAESVRAFFHEIYDSEVKKLT